MVTDSVEMLLSVIVRKPCVYSNQISLVPLGIIYITHINRMVIAFSKIFSYFTVFDVIIDNGMSGAAALYIDIAPLIDICRMGLVFMSANHNLWKLEFSIVLMDLWVPMYMKYPLRMIWIMLRSDYPLYGKHSRVEGWKMEGISQTTFQNAFYWMKSFRF